MYCQLRVNNYCIDMIITSETDLLADVQRILAPGALFITEPSPDGVNRGTDFRVHVHDGMEHGRSPQGVDLDLGRRRSGGRSGVVRDLVTVAGGGG